MKFLVLHQIKRVSTETWAKLLPLHYKYLDDLEMKGKIEISYHLIGRQGNLLIVNADSDEELTKIMVMIPYFSMAKEKFIL